MCAAPWGFAHSFNNRLRGCWVQLSAKASHPTRAARLITSTAMTMRAPNARAVRTGTGGEMSPSKYSRPAIRTRLNVPG